MTTDEIVAAGCPIIAAVGGLFYFDPVTAARGKERGVDAFRLYFLGRGGVLGDTPAAVVHSAFGYFHPNVVAKMWETGRVRLPPMEAAELYRDACADFGRSRLSAIDGLEPMIDALEQVNDAADSAGLTLYAGIKQMALADDPPARAMQLLAVLREFRGSAHLAAVRSVGLPDSLAHCIKRPEMVEPFGWPADLGASVTDEHRALLDEAEVLTDRAVRPAYAVLDAAAGDALLSGVRQAQAAIEGS
jgi:hypothetical protein